MRWDEMEKNYTEYQGLFPVSEIYWDHVFSEGEKWKPWGQQQFKLGGAKALENALQGTALLGPCEWAERFDRAYSLLRMPLRHYSPHQLASSGIIQSK